MTNFKATIFDIQRNSYVDGPGIRTTVFFKGCNLRCLWCHNPESQAFEKQILFYKEKCTACGRCEGLSVDDRDFICFNDAKQICGKECTADEIFAEVAKDKSFYETSGGGVTFSGGECMLQIDFLCEILKKCKADGLHTAVDTAGAVPWKSFERILAHTDLFLYDIKSPDSAIHRKFTGVPNELILENLAKLLQLGTAVWVRIPIIPDVNDSDAQFDALRRFFDRHGHPQKIELLPYHALGDHKYAALGMPAPHFAVPPTARLEALRAKLE